MINMLDLSGQRWSEREQWIHHLHGAVGFMFPVDLSSYNEISLENPRKNKLKESIELFSSLAKSPWSRKTPFNLMLFNLPTLEKKLLISPLSDHFSSYEGTNNAKEACNYIIHRFKAAAASDDMLLNSYFCQGNDFETVRDSMVREIMVISRFL